MNIGDDRQTKEGRQARGRAGDVATLHEGDVVCKTRRIQHVENIA